MTRVKVCGITRWTDARHAADLGVDALGFVFYAKSPRSIRPDRAREIIQKLPPFVTPVGVFVDAPIQEIQSVIQQCRLTAIQLHGNEPPEFCRQFSVRVIKAFRVKGDELPRHISRFPVDAILLDTFQAGVPGGTGSTFCWDVAQAAKQYARVILAGGLNGENIGMALETVQPYAVDVSSGVEAAPGKKDPRLVAEFIQQVKTFTVSR